MTIKAPPPPRGGTNHVKTNGTQSAAPAIGRLTPKFKPPRIILAAVEGFGKTTAGAYAKNPVLIMVGEETGYATLLGSGLVPDIDTAAVREWPEVISLCRQLRSTEHQTIVFDALAGLEDLCQKYVCERDFRNDWTDRGFYSYMKGYESTAREWLVLINILYQLSEQDKTVVFLSHVKIKTFNDPISSNYDRYNVDVHEKIWSETSRWSDCILFGNYETYIESSNMEQKKSELMRKGKALHNTDRVLYCSHHPVFNAKNRYGMPDKLLIPNDRTQAWNTIWNALRKGGKESSNGTD